ncbi:hypothetical protein SynBIOSU31_02771 [Synechococcus sp. BIOS-U3-1]|nr:hypothetical protein SynBIOSU31_02771 [Synechococcus sp. BIOS-U3-1]
MSTPAEALSGFMERQDVIGQTYVRAHWCQRQGATVDS